MALESGTYIDSLNSSNPTTTDGLSQADDHMRLIKSTIKASFPNVTGAVTLTHTEVNALDTRLDDLEGTGQYAPAIVRSSGTPALKSGITAAEIRELIDLGSTDSPTFATINGTTLDLGDWELTVSSGVLKINYQGTTKAKLDSSGNLTLVGNLTAYGTM